VQFIDVEKTMTNVSIKDAPYELDNSYIAWSCLRQTKQEQEQH
jgi:hypothetical protein